MTTPEAERLREALEHALTTARTESLVRPTIDSRYLAQALVSELGITEETVGFLDSALEGSPKRLESYRQLSSALSAILELGGEG